MRELTVIVKDTCRWGHRMQYVRNPNTGEDELLAYGGAVPGPDPTVPAEFSMVEVLRENRWVDYGQTLPVRNKSFRVSYRLSLLEFICRMAGFILGAWPFLTTPCTILATLTLAKWTWLQTSEGFFAILMVLFICIVFNYHTYFFWPQLGGGNYWHSTWPNEIRWRLPRTTAIPWTLPSCHASRWSPWSNDQVSWSPNDLSYI